MEKEKLLKKWSNSGLMTGVKDKHDTLVLAECYEKIDKLLKYKRNKSHLQSGLYGVVMYVYNINILNSNCLIDYDKLILSFIENYKSNKINEKEMTRKESTDYCKNFALKFLNINKI